MQRRRSNCSTRATARTLAAAAAAWLLAGVAVAQWRPVRTVPKPIDFATSQNDNLFSLTRSQDDIHALETAIQELADGSNDAAVRRLHELMRVDPVGVVPVAPGRYLGTRSAVVAVLANMSASAKELYEAFAAREAGHSPDAADWEREVNATLAELESDSELQKVCSWVSLIKTISLCVCMCAFVGVSN